MSLRLSSSQSAHYVSLWGGLGIPGSEVPTDGDNGGSPLVNDGISPVSEYRIETVTAPSAGTLTVYPDTSYLFEGAPDGEYAWVYKVREDSIDRGNATEYLIVGSPVVSFAVTPALPAFSGSITTGGATISFDVTPSLPTFSGSLSISPAVQTSVTADLPTFSGSITTGGVALSFSITPDLPAFSGGVSISPVVSTAATAELPAFSGSISTGGVVVWSSATAPLPSFSGSISSGASVAFNAHPALPTFFGSITGYVPAGLTLSPQDIAAIAAAVIAAMRAANPPVPVECDCPTAIENADALLSRTWP